MLLERKRFLGMSSLAKAQELPLYKAAFVLNMNLGSSTSVAPAKGYSVFGNTIAANVLSNGIIRKYTYERGSGYETDIRVRDDGSNTIVEYLNISDTRNSAKGEWLPLLIGQTTGTEYGFGAFNDTGTDLMYWCNAVDNFRTWTGAIAVFDGAVSAGAATIKVKNVSGDPKTNPTDGFPSSGTITYRDTAGAIKSLAYSSKTSDTFTMTVAGNTTASADNTGVADITTAQAGYPKNNIFITAQGRIWGAGRTDAPNQVQGCKVSDITNWTAGTNPDDPFAKDFPEGGKITALAAKDEWVFIGKERRTHAMKFNLVAVSDGAGGTLQTKTTVEKLVARVGIANQKAVAEVGDDIYFISPKGQIRRLFGLEAESEFQTYNINKEIQPSLVKSVFDDATLEYWEEQDLLVAGFKKDSDSTANDYGEFIWFGLNELGERNLNISFHDWWIGDMNIYDNQLYIGSSVEGENYKALDGYAKNTAPYETKYVMRIEDGSDLGAGAAFYQMELEHLLTKGAIGAGTEIELLVNYDDGGSTGATVLSIDYNDGYPYIIDQPLNYLNAYALGTEPLGGTVNELSELNPFKEFFPLPNEFEPFNWQLEISTSGVGQIYELDTIGWNLKLSEIQFPNNLFLKELG